MQLSKEQKPGLTCTKKIIIYIYIYIYNAVVSTVSAKLNNPDVDVAFVTNVKLETEFRDIFERFGIDILYCPFDSFKFDNNYAWCLAFYKLCVLKYALTLPYENVLCLDSDSYTQSKFSYLWGNLKKNIVLYDRVGSTMEPLEMLKSLDFVRYSYNQRVQRVGGEFFASNIENLRTFVSNAEIIFEIMKDCNIKVESGDEYITSLSAAMLQNIDMSGGRYICRLETGPIRIMIPKGQLSVTPIIHVPGEKKRGMLKIFRYITKRGVLPSNKLVYKFLHINHRSPEAFAKAVILKITGKHTRPI